MKIDIKLLLIQRAIKKLESKDLVNLKLTIQKLLDEKVGTKGE